MISVYDTNDYSLAYVYLDYRWNERSIHNFHTLEFLQCLHFLRVDCRVGKK